MVVMTEASKNWQRGKILTWSESRGGRGPWFKYKGGGYVCVPGVFPYLTNWKNRGIHEEIVKDRIYIYYKDLDVILVEKFLSEVKEVALSGFQQ